MMKNIILPFLLMTVSCPLLFEGYVFAEEGTTKRRVDGFEYLLTDRPDPFYPFISRQAAQQAKADEVINPDEELLTGLRAFEPGQLRLVAVMSTPRGRIAMAEDITGKGYTLREGEEIGRFGRIERIEDGQVIVKEAAPTRAGRIIEREIIMRLRRDGDR